MYVLHGFHAHEICFICNYVDFLGGVRRARGYCAHLGLAPHLKSTSPSCSGTPKPSREDALGAHPQPHDPRAFDLPTIYLSSIYPSTYRPPAVCRPLHHRRPRDQENGRGGGRCVHGPGADSASCHLREAGQSRLLPAWKLQVRQAEESRQRFIKISICIFKTRTFGDFELISMKLLASSSS